MCPLRGAQQPFLLLRLGYEHIVGLRCPRDRNPSLVFFLSISLLRHFHKSFASRPDCFHFTCVHRQCKFSCWGILYSEVGYEPKRHGSHRKLWLSRCCFSLPTPQRELRVGYSGERTAMCRIGGPFRKVDLSLAVGGASASTRDGFSPPELFALLHRRQSRPLRGFFSYTLAHPLCLCIFR